MAEPLETAVVDGVMTVTLNMPTDHNRIDRRMMAAITDAMEAADSDTSVRVIVLTGKGEYFCAGGRVDGFPVGHAEAAHGLRASLLQHAGPHGADRGSDHRGGHRPLHRGRDELAVVLRRGGGGRPRRVWLSGGCTRPISSARARHMIPVFPPKRAFDLLYTGTRFSAQEALALSLVNKVVPLAKVHDAVAAYITSIKRLNPTACGLGRRAYYAMQPMTPASRLQYAQTFLATMLYAEQDAERSKPV